MNFVADEIDTDESPPDAGRAEIPWQAADALASFDRMLAAAEPKHHALIFVRASTEIMRLVDRDSAPAAWSQIVDDLHAMGQRHEIDPVAVQNLMAVATEAAPDRCAGEASEWQPDSADVPLPDHYPESADGEPDLVPEQAAAAAAAPIVQLVFESAASWRGVPLDPVRWLVTRRIPAADVAILSGDGGQGKTTIALQLAVAVAADLGDWLGATCEQGIVMFFSGEESRENIRHKLKAVAAKRGLDPDDLHDLSFHFPEDPMLGGLRKDGTIGATATMQALEASIVERRPALVIIDSVAGTFGGNYIDRVQVRTFVNMLAKVTKAVGCSILLLDHPSMSGMQNGSGRGGSRDWQNAVRAFMYMRPTDNEDGSKGREIEVMKINSGAPGEIQKLHFEDGCFVLVGTAPAPQQAAAHAGADQRYLECLDAMTAQGRNVCPAPGRGYAPKAFSALPQANGMTARAFQQAQERLFAAGTIAVVPYGPASKGAKCIARKV